MAYTVTTTLTCDYETSLQVCVKTVVYHSPPEEALSEAVEDGWHGNTLLALRCPEHAPVAVDEVPC